MKNDGLIERFLKYIFDEEKDNIIIEADKDNKKPYWYDEELYGMSFNEFCLLDDDIRIKLIEEKTGKRFRYDLDTIWIGGTPFFGIKTMEDVDNDIENIINKKKVKMKTIFDKNKK